MESLLASWQLDQESQESYPGPIQVIDCEVLGKLLTHSESQFPVKREQ